MDEPNKQGQPISKQDREELKSLGDPELDPYEIEFLPQFEQGRGPRAPFVNSYGVIIGDHQYESPDSPLENWSADTSPEIMSGDEWVHPYKDVGFHTSENRDYFEKGIAPADTFMHASINTTPPISQKRPEEEDTKQTGAKDKTSGSK